MIHRSPIALAGLLLGLLCQTGMATAPLPNTHLWEFASPASTPNSERAAKQPWFLRERKIHFHQPIVDALRDMTQPLPVKLHVDLMGETTSEFLIQSRSAGPLASTVVQGRLAPPSRGDVTLILRDNVVTGTIHLERRVFKIQYGGDGSHLLIEIDPEKLPTD